MKLLIEGGNSGSGGYIRHLHGILSSKCIPNDIEVSLLCSPRIEKALGRLDTEVKIFIKPIMESRSFWKRLYWWIFGYPKFIKQISPDLIFYPNGYIRHNSRKIPCVTLSHNLLPFDLAEIKRYGISVFAFRMMLTRIRQMLSFQKSEGVIFLSNHAMNITKKVVSKIRKSIVIYHGLDSNMLIGPGKRKISFKSINILYVSTVYLYKHHDQVVLAVNHLREKSKIDLRLTLIGGGEPIAQKKLNKCINNLKDSSFLTVIGNLPIESVLDYYRNSDIFIFASTCETFGITLLEAMGAGLPIVASNQGPMTEILRDCGCYFDPESFYSISEKIEDLLNNHVQRSEYGKKAFESAKTFTWEKCTIETFDFFRSLLVHNN